MHLKRKRNYISIYMMLLGLLLIQIANPLRIYVLVSLGTAVIALAAILAFFSAFSLETKVDSSLSKIFILACVMLFSMLATSGINISNIIKFLCFFEIPLLFYAYKEIDSRRIKKIIYLVYFALSFFYIALSFSGNAHILRIKNVSYIVESLTLGYNNPNETAMYLFVCFSVLLLMFFDVQKALFKFVLLVDLLYIASMIYRTESRTMIVSMIAMVVLTFLFRNKSVPSPLVTFSFVVPLLFIFVLQMYGDLVLLGERIETGRLDIFSRVTEKMTMMKFFIGDYNIKFENLHNLYVSVFGTIGIIGVFTFVLFLIQKVKYALKNAISKVNRIAVIAIIMLIVSSSTEAAVFTAGSAYAASVVTLYVLSILKEGEKDESLTN